MNQLSYYSFQTINKMPDTIKVVQIQHGSKFLRPKLHKKAFYKIFAPIGFKLKSMESITLDLKFNIYSPELQGTGFNLLPTLAQFGLSIEENNWKTASRNESIKICILNKNYTHSFNIKKRTSHCLLSITVHE